MLVGGSGAATVVVSSSAFWIGKDAASIESGRAVRLKLRSHGRGWRRRTPLAGAAAAIIGVLTANIPVWWSRNGTKSKQKKDYRRAFKVYASRPVFIYFGSRDFVKIENYIIFPFKKKRELYYIYLYFRN